MGDEMAARVRSALVELDDIPAAEQQAVLAEFFAGQAAQIARQTVTIRASSWTFRQPASDSIELRRRKPANRATSGSLRFFARSAAPGDRSACSPAKRPQTIAAVMAQLDPHLAAHLLEALPADLATEALERMAWLDDPSPDVLAEIADQLRRELRRSHVNCSRSTSLAGMHALLAAMDANGSRPSAKRLADIETCDWRINWDTSGRTDRPDIAIAWSRSQRQHACARQAGAIHSRRRSSNSRTC